MLEAEWGSCSPVSFAKSTMVDAQGKEIEIPRCETCGNGKVCLIGSRAYEWICYECDNQPKAGCVMTKVFLEGLTN